MGTGLGGVEGEVQGGVEGEVEGGVEGIFDYFLYFYIFFCRVVA